MNPPPLSYRLMEPGEESEVAALALRVFDEAIAPDLTEAGVQEFHRYAAAEHLVERSRTDHFVLLAVEGDRLAGIIEMRACTHVAMLFVGRPGRGIGRELFRRALRICRQRRPDLTHVTVNADPAAVPFYRALGFRPQGPAEERNGLRFVPLIHELHDDPPTRCHRPTAEP